MCKHHKKNIIIKKSKNLTKKNKKIRFLDNKSKHVKTNEDWYPSYDDNTIKVNFKHIVKNMYLISVWGDDDFGMEKYCDTRLEALEIYKKIDDYITKKQLKFMGFVNC